ncbi:hypothetical protein DERP_001314 [Dermatophagoides pteronyssinus]|uniref:Uncharacterized protein n=1 Tax=Dermatophagoides pteronyssinus TaxID=6956 RepID=A0ABQ8JEU3_DERPT|nr:hypothetical protein DERP_001314 [Dermatophagoides pteronyssinus]
MQAEKTKIERERIAQNSRRSVVNSKMQATLVKKRNRHRLNKQQQQQNKQFNSACICSVMDLSIHGHQK